MKSDARTPAERADAVARAAEAAAAARAPRPGEPWPNVARHDANAAARLLAATAELEAHVARARAQLDPLDAALKKIGVSATAPG